LEVKCLSLQSKEYKEFPKEILKLKNIVWLDISAYDKSQLYSNILKNKADKEKYLKQHHHQSLGPWILYPMGPYNRNKIKSIPKEIENLKNLKMLDISNNNLTKKQIKKLKMLLPNCKIVTNYD